MTMVICLYTYALSDTPLKFIYVFKCMRLLECMGLTSSNWQGKPWIRSMRCRKQTKWPP